MNVPNIVNVPNIASNTPLWLALLTTFVAAVSGALIGRTPGRVKYDIVGVTLFAFLLGLGGGIARDVLLGNLPPLALSSPWYVVTVLGAVAVVLVIGRWIPVDGWIFILLDALALGLYGVIAAQMALDFKLPDVGAIAVGILAAIAGGVLVALLRGETPEILRPSQPYAILVLIGVTIFVLLDGYSAGIAAFLCVASVIGLRFATLHWDIRTRAIRPIERDQGGTSGDM